MTLMQNESTVLKNAELIIASFRAKIDATIAKLRWIGINSVIMGLENLNR